MKTFVALATSALVAGCATKTVSSRPVVAEHESPKAPAASVNVDAAPTSSGGGPWIGAAGPSEFVLAGSNETSLGVWVDVPNAARRPHVPIALSLAIDNSGSMAGAKIQAATRAAGQIIDGLADGDVVSVSTFADEARDRLPTTVLDAASRQRALAMVSDLEIGGGTNMFAGLTLGAQRLLGAPSDHFVRRLVVISDGMANIGPSTPDVLGQLAARDADRGIQITGIGVGIDYDERTLDALAVRSNGRLYHLEEAAEMAAILKREVALLQSTMATDAFVEVVPAPGVQLLGVDGVPATWVGGSMRLPIGTLFGGQHRELLVRARVDTAEPGGARPLASVRLHFHDPADGGLQRVEEVVARYDVTTDASLVEQHANARTRAIVAMQSAARAALSASERVNAGDLGAADRELAAAEAALVAGARSTADAGEKKRLEAAAADVFAARSAARSIAAAPPPAKLDAQKARAKEINGRAMRAMGY